MKKNILIAVALLAGFVLPGNSLDLKNEVLNFNPEMLKALRVGLIESYIQNDSKSIFIEWNTLENCSVNRDMLNTWPILPNGYYFAYISSTDPVNFYLCADFSCANKIAKINAPQQDMDIAMYMPPFPWIIDSENVLGFLEDFQTSQHSLTFSQPQELYFNNTGVSVGGKELYAIKSGEYYIAVFKVVDGQELIYDSKMFSVSNNVGINDYMQDKVKVNYVNGKIEIDNQLDKADFALYDLTGKLLKQGKLVLGKTSVNVSSKATGVYIVNIKGKNFNFSKKVLVK
ncbi:MAG: T9SS type A sorting domain-containing protein [Elusimicrobiaceae bacterium]|nr:T9SS type A sorting domain-containing protein [Elusimicrobiaceae bacterium]MBQ6224259.1 T9SS type A sorting domain-containing protein [Campylobacter sp.]